MAASLLELVDRADELGAALRQFEQHRAFYRMSALLEEVRQIRLKWDVVTLELARLATQDPALARRFRVPPAR